MQAITRNDTVVINGNNYRLKSIQIPTPWSVGAIKRPDITDEQYGVLIDTLVEAVVAVDQAHIDRSGCTDGRVRLHLLDGSEPVDWQKTVGADVMECFVAAEALGELFYGSDKKQASVMERFAYVVDHMAASGVTPTTHEGCGARKGVMAVIENARQWADDSDIVEPLCQRLSVFTNRVVTPDDVKAVTNAWADMDTSGYDESVARQIVLEKSGKQAVEVLEVDSSELHGHTETSRLHMNTPNLTFSTRKYKKLLSASHPELARFEAFAVNDDRINVLLAEVMADDESQQKQAVIAMHLFADVGHDTLSEDLPTYHLSLAD